MGDPSTHLIFYNAYWRLVYEEDKYWVDTETGNNICLVGKEKKLLDLKEV